MLFEGLEAVLHCFTFRLEYIRMSERQGFSYRFETGFHAYSFNLTDFPCNGPCGLVVFEYSFD